MPYLLLTGCTGLVGRYLLRDLILAQESVAVIVRPGRHVSSRQRIEVVMSYWEQQLERKLPRPVVLEGDLNEPLMGLDSEQLSWIQGHCDRILHNAASMTFREDEQGEPFRTNIRGLENLLEVCRRGQIRKMHHVSTAYLCGLRQGRVRETELDMGQTLGNVYEQSKLEAEKLIRAEPTFDELTIFRPASVVGDSRTGVTWSYHGFYLPLQLAAVVSNVIPPAKMNERFVKLLGLRGDEGKNLVPVDWLSQAIVHLVTHPEHHNQTYHLTHPEPVTVKLIQQVVQQAIEQYSPRPPAQEVNQEQLDYYEKLFLEYMEIYRSHWRDDPLFDRSHTDAVLPHLPCPEMTYDVLLRVARYPVEHNFAPRKFEIPPQTPDVQAWLEPWLAAAGDEASSLQLGMQVTGPGGGQWTLLFRDGELIGAKLGLSTEAQLGCYLNSETFQALRDCRITVDQAVSQGLVMIEGNLAGGSDPADLLAHVVQNGHLAVQRGDAG